MISKVVEILNKNGFRHIVTTVNNDNINDSNIFIIKDVRSAFFYALGLYKEGAQKIAVLCEEDFISSAYTAITECWFQRVPILIVTFNSIYTNGIDYLKRCVDKISIARDYNELNKLVTNLENFNSPWMIRLQEFLQFKEYDYSFILGILTKKCNEPIFIYNSNHIYNIPNVRHMNASHMYGALSKYVGYCVSQPSILCIPEEYLFLDINVFNSRYINNNFKVVVLGNASMLNFTEWTRKCSIDFIESTREELQKQCNIFIKMQSPTILYIK